MENSTLEPTFPQFSILPKNLREQVVGFLLINDLKNFRMVSKQCREDASFTICNRLNFGKLLQSRETWTNVLDEHFVKMAKKELQKRMGRACCDGTTDYSPVGVIVLFVIAVAVIIFGFVRLFVG